MSKHTNEILFEYLRAMLFENQTTALDLSVIDTDYLDLAQGLIALEAYIKELQAYSAALSLGNLSTAFPKKNPLCMNLKNLHSNLNHLTWQAQQVANGDYKQKVSYLGDFSVSFQQMTDHLIEREALLLREKQNLAERAELAQNYNEMLKNLSNKRQEWIFILNKETKKVLHCSYSQANITASDPCQDCCRKDRICQFILAHKHDKEHKKWQYQEPATGKYFSITVYDIIWENVNSYAYLAEDITAYKLEEKHLSRLAYTDAKTGLYNNRYVRERLNYYINENISFSLAFLDIDGLKFVNDHYGHLEGDSYINYIVSSIQSILRPIDTFARIGGDEFLVIFRECLKTVVDVRLSTLYQTIRTAKDKNISYERGFSFGITEYNGKQEVSIDTLIHTADENMYQFKIKHKSET